MSVLANWLKGLAGRQLFKTSRTLNIRKNCMRTFADTPKDVPKTNVTSKQVMVQGTEKEEWVRVRRARPGDVPRVLRFVRAHASLAWPGLAEPAAHPQLILCDYVARSLAQGHSMLAEQQQPHRGWSQIRGLALAGAVCPWDAPALEKWARCMRCARSRRLMHFTAHCLRAPALHDKYKVHNILQVVLIVPPGNPKSNDIVNTLAKYAIKRAKETGFPLIRFDVTNDNIAKSLEGTELKKEWQLTYNVLPDILRDRDELIVQKSLTSGETHSDHRKKTPIDKSYIAVYSALTGDANKSKI